MRATCSFASSFMMRGGSLASLREILGHATMAMTLRYRHLSPAHLRGEMERTAAPAVPDGTKHSTKR